MATTFQQTATLFIIGVILSLTQGQNIDPEILGKIDDYIQNFYLPATQTTTLGLSIVQNDGEVLYSTGYGYADQDKFIPNGNQTQFQVGSATKSFTSVIVIKVLSEKFPELGEKVLDTPIRKLIPSANFTLNDRFRSEHTTFRDLLAHRTCISSNDLPLMTDAFDSAEDLTYRVRYTEEVCGIRSEFQYNNQMFVVAGHLAGLIANRSYEDLMQDLLTDLGMLNSSLTKLSDDFSNMPYRAMPYYVLNNVSYPFNTDLIKRVIPFNAAGGLYATPDDMTRYMRFHLNFGSLDGKQVLPEAVMRWMTKPAIVAPWFAFKSSEEEKVTSYLGYGLGLFLGQHGGWQYVYHGGFWAPYLTRMSLFPKKKVAVFTSANQGPASMNHVGVHTFIYDTLTGVNNGTEKASERLEKLRVEQARQVSEQVEAVPKFMQTITTATKQNEDISGKYGSGSSGNVEIFEKFNHQTDTTGIYMSYGRLAQAWLENIGGAYYRLIWDSDVIQDYYAVGDTNATEYAKINNGTLEFLSPQGDNLVSQGKFELGVSLDNLPPIPWAPGSCEPE